jgi:hypothetical protein
MKKLALLFLALPLAACSTSPQVKSASYVPCVPHSHWEMANGCHAFSAGPTSHYSDQQTGNGAARNEPAPTNAAGGIGRGDLYPGNGVARGDF